jgi:hypothetical protein
VRLGTTGHHAARRCPCGAAHTGVHVAHGVAYHDDRCADCAGAAREAAAAVARACERWWAPLAAELRVAVTDATWEIWLRPLQPRAELAGVLFVEAPPHLLSWVSDRYGPALARAAQRLGLAAHVEIVAPGWEPPETPNERPDRPVHPSVPATSPVTSRPRRPAPRRPRPTTRPGGTT